MRFQIGNTPARKGNGATYRWLVEHKSYRGDDCLIWPFSRPNGYGMFGYLGKLQYAHRWMCEQVNGPAPSSEHYATHTCGNGRGGCVNQNHLRWATSSQNQLDRREHGNSFGGHRGKLSREQKVFIRDHVGTLTHRQMADHLGVDLTTISKVIERKSWDVARGVVQIGSKWRARVTINKRSVLLGYFESREAAIGAYDQESNRLRSANNAGETPA